MVNTIRRRLQIIQLVIRLYRTYRRIERIKAHDGEAALVERLYAAAGRDIRETASRLCGAVVKAGQFLSMRHELFPLAFPRELEGLQDKVPPAPFSLIRNSISDACDEAVEDIFSHIEAEPIASGSLAQVHRATFKDGRHVAIKVLRPGIQELVAVDLATLGHVARVADKIPSVRRRIDFKVLHQAFQTTLTRELDMRAEAGHMERFRRTIGDDQRIVIPEVIPDCTTTTMLAMTFIEGANIRDSEQLQAWHIDRFAIRDALLDAYLEQLLVTGFVHLDPHPGNMVILRDGKLALLDFGMVATYNTAERTAFRNLIQRVFFRDGEGVVRVLQELGYVRAATNPSELAQTLKPLLGRVSGADLRNLLQTEDFQIQAKYMLLVRCLGMLKTALQTLTPDESAWSLVVSDHVLPYLMSPLEPYKE